MLRFLRVGWLALALPAIALPSASAADAASNAAGSGALSQVAKVLGESTDARFQADILRGIRAALQGRRTAPMPAGWDAVEAKLAASADSEVRTLTQTLSLTFGSPRALAALRATAVDPRADAEARRTALDSLLAVHDPELAPVLQKLVGDAAVRATALRGLAAYDDAATPAAILGAFGALDGGERRDALNTLASRVGSARALVEALGAGKVPRTEVNAVLVRQLRSLKDAGINAALDKLWGVVKETNADQKKEIERYTRVYWAGGSTPGDAPRGRVVFNKTCAPCHTLFDTGGKVGPDITGANRADLNYLLENILYPNAVIPNEYRASTVETKDERVLTGIVKEQDANVIALQTANELVRLPRNEVKKIEQSDISMMPEGLLAGLSEVEIRDLLYYLGRPGQVPLPAGAK